MNWLLRSLLVLTPVLGVAAACIYCLRDAPTAPPETTTALDTPVVTPPGETVAVAPAPRAGFDPETPVSVVFAVKPKELSPAVKKGLEYLVKAQQEDGGWNQGGGWRIGNTGGGRIEGPKVEDPSDIGNTALALLAFVRAGNTPTEGAYKDAVKKGLKFVIDKVAKADSESLYVTDVRGTQLQSKIGPYVDTFLVNFVLAELRGKAGDQE